jgi:hypothetical protein
MRLSAVTASLLLLLLHPATRPEVVCAQTLAGTATFVNYTYDNGANGPLASPGFAFYDIRADELFVCSPGNRRIIVYDADLTSKYTFAHYVRDRSGRGMIEGEPRAAVVNSRGEILVLDNLADYVDVLDYRGSQIDRIYPSRLLKDSTLKIHPDLMAMDGRDNLYLSISGDVQSILVLDENFELKRQIIAKGSTNAPDLPAALAVEDSLLVVTDMQGKPVVRVYDTLGQYLTGFGGREIERTDFSLPVAAASVTDSLGHTVFLVADALRQVIKVLDQNGQLISMIGGFGAGLGAFQYPSGLAYGGKWTFFVVERVGGRVQKFILR